MADRHDGSCLNREGWLTACAQELEPLIRTKTGLRCTKTYRLACGWPSRKGMSDKNRRIGECWNAADRSCIFISPAIDESIEVAETVAHEMLHAFLPKGVGHGAPFSQAAKKLGLVGKPTDTHAGKELRTVLVQIVERLGPYPHRKITPDAPRERGRNLKFSCACGYIGRTSAFHLDNAGAPICPTCRTQMVSADAKHVTPLQVLTQVTEYMVPGYEARFVIMCSRTNRNANWYLLDYGDDGFAGGGVARHTQAKDRDDALSMINGLAIGTITYETLEAREIADGDPNFGEYLGEDEDEEPDYPEDQVPDTPDDRQRRQALKLLHAV